MIGARVDRRADVWSLGVILWELIAGRVLFKRKTETETVVAVTRMTRPPLSSMRPGISPRLEEIVERALAREPDDRHATAAALADDLEAWLAEQPGPADAAEVSAWMHRLFPGEPEEEERLVSAALADALPTVDERSPIERSAVVRRSSGPPRLSRRAAIGAYVLAVALAMAVGALAALWSRGDAMRTSAPDATREDATSSPARKAAPAESTDVGPIRAPPNPDAPASEVLAPGHGTVSIAAVGGGADVYERGHRLGTIPGEFMLPEGRHVLVLRSHGGAELHRIGVRVRAGHASRVHVDLGR
jgi:serine/threonine-protein kinase